MNINMHHSIFYISVCSKQLTKCYVLFDMHQSNNDVKATWTFVDTQICSYNNWSLVSLRSELEQDFVGHLLQDKFDIDGIIFVYIGNYVSKTIGF